MDDPAVAGDPVFLQPGEVLTTTAALRVKTILGSCLGITIRAPGAGYAAIAHCVLPEAAAAVDPADSSQPARYVDTAVASMLRLFAEHGASRGELEIKLFGGADAMGAEFGVGKRNIEVARRILLARGMAIAASAVGGNQGRVIVFDTGTGEVLLRTLPPRIFKKRGLLPV